MASDTIIVGVSSTESSRKAMQWAAQRAAATGQRLRLVHVVDDAIGAAGHAELLFEAKRAAQQVLDDAVRLVAQVAPGVETSAELQQGDAVEVFERLSSEASVVVVGSDWSKGGKPSTRGVHSLRIAAVSAVPVIVVPDIDVSSRSGVVVGIDGGEVAARAAEFAAAQAEQGDQVLTLAYAWEVMPVVGYEFSAPIAFDDEFAEAAKEVANSLAEKVREAHPGLVVETSVVPGDAVNVLIDAAADAALLVVGTHGREGLARFLLGSVSHGVLAHLVAPTAVVR